MPRQPRPKRDNAQLIAHIDEVAVARGLNKGSRAIESAVNEAIGLKNGLGAIYRGGYPEPETLVKLARWARENPIIWFRLAHYITDDDLSDLQRQAIPGDESGAYTGRDLQIAAGMVGATDEQMERVATAALSELRASLAAIAQTVQGAARQLDVIEGQRPPRRATPEAG